LVSLSQLQEIPSNNIILLIGPPGSGKSTFCEQTILQSVAVGKPIIYVTTTCGPSNVEIALKERGLREVEPGTLYFVDAYNETVGISVSDRPDTVNADCNNLSSIDIAISKLQDSIGKKSALLVFNSLTSPYLFSKSEILRFITQTLSRFAARGNAVLACIDQGCGKEEDLVAMMSLSNGVIKVETEKDKRFIDVVKHPKVTPTNIEVPTLKKPSGLKFIFEFDLMDPSMGKQCYQAVTKGDDKWLRKEVGDFVNLFWTNLVTWSGMLWDPKRFPTMKYELDKSDGFMAPKMTQFFPWHTRLLFKLLPKDLNKVSIMKNLFKANATWCKQERSGIMEYIEGASKPDEHIVRVYENYACCGLENVGDTIA
jgi:KaiC/GvpD/RAD55 family RecA-like ATPase